MNDPSFRKSRQKEWKTWYLLHRESAKKSQRDRNERLKIEVLTHYSPNGVIGCSCPECDIAILDFLTIDHIGGGGRKHIKSIGVSPGIGLYNWLKKNKYPPGFRTLCMNCNHGSGKNGNNGICPHQNM